MYAAPGIGLAASQVDVHQRFMVIDVSENNDTPRVFINPEILQRDGEQVYQEGCLSVPGIFADVSRANQITVKALGRDGQPFELQTDGVLAVCIQHEMDHLAGKLFVDYLSPLKREMVRKKLAKARRLGSDGTHRHERHVDIRLHYWVAISTPFRMGIQSMCAKLVGAGSN